ncbi:hypothetical protein MP638_007193 [Amoeboaphelidium occidentale]|nr:hypothetical protein MP638_007193 [Amoeboaphelidium occidentale]
MISRFSTRIQSSTSLMRVSNGFVWNSGLLSVAVSFHRCNNSLLFARESSNGAKAIQVDKKIVFDIEDLEMNHCFESRGTPLSIEDAKNHKEVYAIPNKGTKTFVDDIKERLGSLQEGNLMQQKRINHIEQFITKNQRQIIFNYFSHTNLFMKKYPEFAHWNQLVHKADDLSKRKTDTLSPDETEFLVAVAEFKKKFGEKSLDVTFWDHLRDERNNVAHPQDVSKDMTIMAVNHLAETSIDQDHAKVFKLLVEDVF